MATSSSSSTKSPTCPSLQPSHFTPIQECDKEEHDGETPVSASDKPSGRTAVATPPPPTPPKQHHHHPTPLYKNGYNKSRSQNDDASVSCNKCRPNSREKISVVPLDNNGVSSHNKLSSPNGIFKSILSSLTRRSPRPETTSTAAVRDEQWKIAAAELSHKLIQATRKRDEAVQEASRLKNSMAELEKKLNKLEQYCHSLKSGLDECASIGTGIASSPAYHRKRRENETVEKFLVSVSEARNSVRTLARSLATQLRHVGAKVYERISILLQPYDAKISPAAKNPRALLFCLEAILNKAFFEDFETSGFQRNAVSGVLDPAARCDANRESFDALKGLTWEQVLCRGTRHFSEDFSKFCDRKMSEIVATLGWNRAWPEPLLQAFFGASKSVWLVHLLANSLRPAFEVFRIENGAAFDPVYMEDIGAAGDKTRRLVPSAVRMMVAPGFYVCGSVVKCKVLCRYTNNGGENESRITGGNNDTLAFNV